MRRRFRALCWGFGWWHVLTRSGCTWERTAYAVSGALLLAGVTGVLATVITERLRLSWLCLRARPGAARFIGDGGGTGWFAVAAWALCGSTNRAAPAGRGAAGHGGLWIVLRLCHPSLFDEVRRFIARRNWVILSGCHAALLAAKSAGFTGLAACVAGPMGTQRIGQQMGALLSAGDVLLLEGAARGKTCLTQGLAIGLGVDALRRSRARRLRW